MGFKKGDDITCEIYGIHKKGKIIDFSEIPSIDHIKVNAEVNGNISFSNNLSCCVKSGDEDAKMKGKNCTELTKGQYFNKQTDE